MKCRVEKRNAFWFPGDEVCRKPCIEATPAAAATPDLREPQLALAPVPALCHLLLPESSRSSGSFPLSSLLFLFSSLPSLLSVWMFVGVG